LRRADLACVTLWQVFFGSDDELDFVEVTDPQLQGQSMLITKLILPNVPKAMLLAAHASAVACITMDFGKAFELAPDNFVIQVEV
jgi:hypothetical protein